MSNIRCLDGLELVIRCYPDGQLTRKYLRHLQLGDTVEFRGLTGAMRCRKGIIKCIGMVADGTGSAPTCADPVKRELRALMASSTRSSLPYAKIRAT